jgi:hypothetical protein
VIRANNVETALVGRYADWLEKQGCRLQAIRFGGLCCDGYEGNRRNLIEAKSSTKREDIRMAVGELLDYAFLARKKFGELNKAVLLPAKPKADIEKWLRDMRISVIWRELKSFSDNANGQFTCNLAATRSAQ